MARLIGDTVDISKCTYFVYYDLYQYQDKQSSEENPKIGRLLGVFHRVFSAVCYWMLTYKGEVIAGTTVQHVTQDEVATDDCDNLVTHFHDKLDVILFQGKHYVVKSVCSARDSG